MRFIALVVWCMLAGSVLAEPTTLSVDPPGQVPLVTGPSSTRAEAPPWSSGELRSAAPSSADLTLQRLFTLIDERDRQYTQRFADNEKAVNAALVSAKEAVNAALAAAKEAVSKAEVTSNERLNTMNEFRGQQKDMISTLMPRSEADTRFAGIEGKLSEMHDVVVGLKWIWAALGALGTGIIAVAGLVMNWRKSQAQ